MINEAQLNMLLEDLKQDHHLDFYFYSRESFIRRISRMLKLDVITDFDDLRKRLKDSPGYVDHFLDRITVNVTDMFRDPLFFTALREDVLPEMAHLPKIRIWHPGCSSGEEVLSVAILLKENGLLEKSEIIGTDLSPKVLDKARNICFTETQLQHFKKNYEAAGGKEDFSAYFQLVDNLFVPIGEITRYINYEMQNLANQACPGKFDLIVCRNVLIYFEREAGHKVFHAFNNCCTPGSFLALGEKETLQFSPIEVAFTKIRDLRIWRKI
jgi:chemotaxis protein methyltransferase CheR